MSARRLWNDPVFFAHMNELLQDSSSQNSISCVTSVSLQRCQLKVRNSHGRKKAEWDAALHKDLRLRFD